MTTTINADTVVGGAVVTADASGLLGLQAAGNTGLTLNSSRAVGVGATPSFGTSGQLLQSAGSAAAPAWATVTTGYTLGTPVATTSGTSIDFTGIPAGTKQIVFTFFGVSTNSTSVKLIQLGDSGGVEITGYLSAGLKFTPSDVNFSNQTAGYCIFSDQAADVLNGSVIFTLQSSSTFTWVAQGALFFTSNRAGLVTGSKSLSAELTSVRLTTLTGTDTFDAGSLNIAYI